MPQKRCSSCRSLLDLDAFAVRRASADGRQSRCRQCWRAWYVAHRAEHVARVGERNERARAAHRERLTAYLLEHPCVDCNEADLRVLDLDHENPEQKLSGVARLLGMHVPWERIEAEIEKCSVRCANCHRRRTAEQLGYWRHEAETARRAAATGHAAERLEALDLVRSR